MKKIFPLFCVFIYLVIYCSDNKEAAPVIVEDFTLPQEANPALSSLFTKNYELTPLETTDNCLIGRIGKIKKFRKNYYILSNDESILRFNEQGKFISSLNKLGQGPEEYHRIEDFDVYEINGQTEVWISDNVSLKVYDGNDFTFKYKISYPFVIHKFRRLENSHILLLTGQNNYSLTLTDKEGTILSEYLEKEFPFLMFRGVMFIPYGSGYLYQLGVSNACIVFDPETEMFRKERISRDKSFLSDQELLNLYERYDLDYLREMAKSPYINGLRFLNDITWVYSFKDEKNYLTKVSPEQSISTAVSRNSVIENDLFDLEDISFITNFNVSESDNSLLFYINAYTIAENKNPIYDKYGNWIHCHPEDNPCIIEFK